MLNSDSVTATLEPDVVAVLGAELVDPPPQPAHSNQGCDCYQPTRESRPNLLSRPEDLLMIRRLG
jgi:hypothetical protein